MALSAVWQMSALVNIYGRNSELLNGRWDAIVDLYDQGGRMKVYENRPARKYRFL